MTILIEANTAQEALYKAPIGYGIVEDVTDEDNGAVYTRTYAVFATTEARDLYLSTL